MTWVDRKDEYEAISREIDSAVRLVTKDSWPWRVMAALVTACTFGGIRYHAFLEDYATTIGPIQGYPRAWKTLSRPLLIHEAQHTRQSRLCGLGLHPWLGLPLFGVLYLLFLLPLGFAVFRWQFEINADKASYRWMMRNGARPDQILRRARLFGAKVCGGNYGWSFPLFLGGVKAFEKAAESVIAEFRKDDTVPVSGKEDTNGPSDG